MKKQSGFEKFMSKEKKGAAKKEQLRQDKRKWKKEMNEQKQRKADERRGIKPRTDDERPSQRQYGTRNSEPQKKTYSSDDKSKKPALEKRSGGKVVKSAGAPAGKKSLTPASKHGGSKEVIKKAPATMPLNKYIAHSGICSRRDAAELVKKNKVKVNGVVITEPGYKVLEDDEVQVDGKKIQITNQMVYILLNKPKDYITTTEDPEQRKTVLQLIGRATTERVYPVGRLDRNTSGVLLLTNDGDLSQKLTHPSNEIKKLYAVTLDKPLTKNHFEDILKGVPLEDGMAHVDSLAYTDTKDHTQIGVELHSGRNRIVRRIFEHFGYDVKALDRVMFAGLTKKNVQRGKWRLLTEREVRDLKYFKKGKK